MVHALFSALGNYGRTETSVVLKYILISSKIQQDKSNRNKCCIEILIILMIFLFLFLSNRNKCCIEMLFANDSIYKVNRRTETSVVLKFRYRIIRRAIFTCRTETSVVLKFMILFIIDFQNVRRTETSVVLKSTQSVQLETPP